MPVNSVGSSAATPALDPTIQKIIDAVDTNHDGQISKAEFGAFLLKILGGVPGNSVSGPVVKATAADTSSTSPAATLVSPSSWTDNNSPYGVTFAGFSPQAHTDLTLADLGTPGKAEKYAVYDYLLSNKIQATNNWAPAAADALNQQYNTTVFHALDGETIAYGNEYIHSAANGYGMSQGSYNPSATGEFFWGWN